MKTKFPIFALTALVASLAGCGGDEVKERAEVVRPAKILEVEMVSNEKRLTFPAVVEAISSKDLTFQVSGQIDSLKVVEGQEVKEGDVIATIVKRDYENQLTAAQTQFDTAKIEFERAERLIAGNAISQSQFDQRKSQLEIANAQLDSAKKALEDTTLVSPFDGIIAIKHAEELQTVTPSAPIVTLQTEGAAEALVKIPASIVSRSKQIQPIETVIVLDAAPDQLIPASVVSFSTVADEQSQTFDVHFGFVPPENFTILPGMTGLVKSTISFIGDANTVGQIQVPLHAIVTSEAEQYVWVVDAASMTVSKRVIEIGPGIGEKLVVESGLEAGDLIVGAGASYLHEGMKIRRLAN